MRDWWYGDKRDVVKWGTVLVLARKWSIRAVLQVALCRPTSFNYQLNIGETTEPLPVEVVRHFRDIDDIQRLAEATNLKIDIYKDTFRWNHEFRTREDFRADYFDKVTTKIQQYRDPVIVFLDPDTGIAPVNYDYKHVTHQEIRKTLQAMKTGDVLLFYQHARLGDRGWINSTKEEFCEAIGIGVPVETITCNQIANDVMFFVVERSKWIELAIDT
jgi:hypothetical protein